MNVEEVIRKHKVVCWYPSAGADFRELLFLSDQYCRWKDVPIEKEKLPDLFILTDCNPTDYCFGFDSGIASISKLNSRAYRDLDEIFHAYNRKTRITLNERIRVLEDINIPFDRNLYTFEVSDNYGKVFLMNVHITSKQLGEWDADVLYILTENTRFAFDYLVKKNISIDYIIRVRYGDAFGGSVLNARWLLKLIKPLHVKYFLSQYVSAYDFDYDQDELADDFGKEYGDIIGQKDIIPMEIIHKVDAIRWSGQCDIYWYKII